MDQVAGGRRNKRVTKAVFNQFRITVAILTFIAYVMVRANRKSLSGVKVLFAEEWSPSRFNNANNNNSRLKEPIEIWSERSLFSGSNSRSTKAFFGILNTVFMAGYAASQYLGGFVGDRINLRYFLCTTMIGTSIMITFFGSISEWIGIYSIPWYIAFWTANALLQGPSWPCLLTIMGNWFGKANRGLILGVWTASGSVGNVVGALLVANMVDYGYEIALLIPAVLQLAVAIILIFGLVTSPEEVGMKLSEFEEKEGDKKNEDSAKQEPPPTELLLAHETTNFVKPVSFTEALCLPGVIMYSLAFACVKIVNYTFFFWLPFYLNRRFHWSQAEADNLSIWYDVGGIIGAILIGMLSDRWCRSFVIFASLILALPTIVIFNFLPGDKILNSCVMFVIGFLIYGVANILSGAVASDLGRHPKLSSSKTAMATVSGIMEGTGSSGAALGQIAIPLIEQEFGWSAVFYLLIVCTFLTALIVGRMVYSDLWPLDAKELKKMFCPCFPKDKIQPQQNEMSKTNEETTNC